MRAHVLSVRNQQLPRRNYVNNGVLYRSQFCSYTSFLEKVFWKILKSPKGSSKFPPPDPRPAPPRRATAATTTGATDDFVKAISPPRTHHISRLLVSHISWFRISIISGLVIYIPPAKPFPVGPPADPKIIPWAAGRPPPAPGSPRIAPDYF